MKPKEHKGLNGLRHEWQKQQQAELGAQEMAIPV